MRGEDEDRKVHRTAWTRTPDEESHHLRDHAYPLPCAQCFIPYAEFYMPHVHSGGISLTFTDLKVILSTPEDPQNLSVQLNFVHKFV